MRTYTSRLLLSLFLIFSFLSSDAHAWFSMFTWPQASTHKRITSNALAMVDANEYPDIARFADALLKGSEDEKTAHPAGITSNVGDPKDIWDNQALTKYKEGKDFNAAYKKIGAIVHLVEDMAVPAHAFDIPHVYYWEWNAFHMGDGLEWFARGNYNPGAATLITGNDPVAYYLGSRTNTLSDVNSATISDPLAGNSWTEYWQDKKYGPRQFPSSTDALDEYLPVHGEFASNRLGQAIGYSAGALAAASKALPPVVTDLSIMPLENNNPLPYIDKANGSTISFRILDNRKSTVTIRILVDGTEPIIIQDYGTGVPFELSAGQSLPFEGAYTVIWDGKLANGSLPPDGQHTLKVTVIDADGHPAEASQEFIISTFPVVESTTPADKSYNVDTVSPVTITFDRAMDAASVENAVTFSPAVQAAYTWSSDAKTVTINHGSVPFTPNTDYTVTVADTARDANQNQLDGDRDFKAGGNHVFKFSTATPELKLTMDCDYKDGANCWVKDGVKMITVDAVDATTKAPVTLSTPPALKWTPPGGAATDIQFASGGAGTSTWTGTINVTKGMNGAARFDGDGKTTLSGMTSFNIDTEPPAIHAGPGNMISCDCAKAPVSLKYEVNDSGSGVKEVVPEGLGTDVSRCLAMGSYTLGVASATDNVGNSASAVDRQNVSPMNCDHPDDNFSVSGSLTGGNGGAGAAADVLTLKEGNYLDFGMLMDRIKGATSGVDLNALTPGAVGVKPLIIPSGGLMGLEKSELLKGMLDEYVKAGGILVVFSQQTGLEFSMLPVPQEADGTYKHVTGYGWTEDQSCFANAVYFDTWHQMFSGQSRVTPTLNVDGYFTNYPSSSMVLLRRTANGQPAMIMYPHGNGLVIATTMYSDWAYGHSQASGEEIALVRDMIEWVKAPVLQFVEVKPGENVSLSMPVVNNSMIDAAQVRFTVLDPDRNFVGEQVVSVAIPWGTSLDVPLSYAIGATAPLGIWHVDYTLLDVNGSAIQPQAETDGGRFAVSNPPANPYKSPEFNFSVQSDSEQVAYGSPVVFTINIWNNTDADRNISVKYFGAHLNVTGTTTMTIGRHSVASFQVIANVTHQGWLSADFFDETEKRIGYSAKGIWMFWPSVEAKISSDKAAYVPGDTVALTVDVSNKQSVAYPVTLKVAVTDSLNAVVYSNNVSLQLLGNEAAMHTFAFQLPANAARGYYKVTAEVDDVYGKKIGGSGASFNLPKAFVSVTSTLPVAFGALNNVSFNIKNSGIVLAASMVFTLELQDHNGATVWRQDRTMAGLMPGETAPMDFQAPFDGIQFGDYALVYSVNVDGLVYGGREKISNAASITLTADKSSYRVRETANVTVDVKNIGRFDVQGATLTVRVPDANYTFVKAANLPVGASQNHTFAIPIPATITPGQHDATVTFELASGSSIVKIMKLSVPASELSLSYEGATVLHAGDNITLALQNTGGVDTTYVTQRLALTDNKGMVLSQGVFSGAVLAGEATALPALQISAQTFGGGAVLNALLKDTKTGKLSSYTAQLEVNGLSASLMTKTGKPMYLKTENVSAVTTLANGPLNVEGGRLDLKVYPATIRFKHFLPKDGWAGFGYPQGVTVSPVDGMVYVVDTGNNQIQKFDANWNLIGKFGGYCVADSNRDGIPEKACDGQFNNPTSLTFASDGSMYVADAYNYRIQKFDAGGRYIAKWGTYGVGDGQFSRPERVATGPDGNIYVSDAYNHRIQKFDGNGNFIAKWGGYGNVDGQLMYPHGLAFGPDGYLYVADSSNNRIQTFDAYGNFIGTRRDTTHTTMSAPIDISFAQDGSIYVLNNYRWISKFDGNWNLMIKWGSPGAANGEFSSASSLSVSPDGSVYLADNGNSRIQKFDSNGYFVAKLGKIGAENGDFAYPNGVAVDAQGYIYVADSSNARIQRFDGSGNFIAKWGSHCTTDTDLDGIQDQACDGQFSYYIGSVATGPDGSVYVADTSNNRIQKFDSNGNFITQWGGYCATDTDWNYIADQLCEGLFNNPIGIAVGPDGSVYVTDTHNHRVQKFDSSGNFVNKWGYYGYGAYSGYWGREQFIYPKGIAVGPDGLVYVGDTGNNRIQKFDDNGNFVSQLNHPGGQLMSAVGLAVGSDNSLYVTDPGYIFFDRVLKFDGNGSLVSEWRSYGGSEDGQFYGPFGIAVGPDGSVYLSDVGNSRIQRLGVAGSEILFSASIPVNQAANTTQDYATDIGVLNAAGKLYLEATLTNSLGQSVATSLYPFYIAEGNTALMFNTDKKFYKPGETVTVTGEVANLAAASLDNATLTLASGAISLLNQTISVLAGGSHAFTVTTVAGAKGIVQLSGSVKQNGATLVEMSESYEVAEPAVALTLSAPDVAGKNPFDVNVEIKNTGKVDATVNVNVTGAQLSDARQLTIPAGQSKLLQYVQSISGDAYYTVNVTGDAVASASRTVVFGEAASVTLTTSVKYVEGAVSVPVSISNTGRIAEDISVTYSLAGGSGAVSSLTKSYYLPMGASVTDELVFDLVKGGYTLSAQGSISGASASSSFAVLKPDDVAMTLSVGAPSGAGAGVTVGVTNGGFNALNGAVQVTVVDATGATVWSGETPLAGVLSGAAVSPAFNIATAALAPGEYTVKAAVYDGAGVLVTSSSSPLNVTAPAFRVTPPANIVFNAGTGGNFVFSVTNTGGQEGEAALTVRALDEIDSTVRDWIKPGETKTYSFPIAISADLEDKDYFADYSLNGAAGQVKFHVNGIKITVNAALDKVSYGIGETAVLTMQVTDNRVNATQPAPPPRPGMPPPPPSTNLDINFFARVNFAGYEDNQTFMLGATPSVTLQFNVPVSALTGEKLFYGVYHESGRSIHLNSLYVYGSDGPVNIMTDKQVYNPGETIAASISGASGTLVLEGPGGYAETFAFTGSASRSIALPALMTAGTYPIRWTLIGASGSVTTGAHPIDVDGIQVKVKEAALDRAKYPASADVALKLTVESNRNMAATLKTWFVDPSGAYTASASKGIALTSDAPVMEGLTASFTTQSLGIHRLVYAIYDGDILLSSGSEAFDVGEAVLLGVSTDKPDYPFGTEAVNAAISLFGTVPATVDLYVDGLSAGSFTPSLNGFTTHTVPLTSLTPGAHTLKAVLSSGGLTSVKETGFVYGSALPDLAVTLGTAGVVGADNKMAVTVTVVNTGKTASSATTVTLYDAAPGGGIGAVLERFAVGPLAPGASASFTYYLNVVGRGGANTLYASVDGGDSVYEFNNSNNAASASIDVPEVVFHTTVGADVNYTGDTMYITANITNLSAAQLAGLTLVTSVKDASGAQIHSVTDAVPAINAVTQIPFVTQWYIPDDTSEGQYTVSQTLGMGSRSYGTTVKTVTVKPGRDFTMESNLPGLKVESGGAAEFTVVLTPVRGFADEVTLSVSGAPHGATVQLSKDTLTPPDSTVVSIGAPGVAAGTYVITVSASGGGKTHSVDLTLDVADFAITLIQSTQTVRELETAAYGVNIAPLNGFESPVVLSIEGLPRGMKAVFDSNNVMPPASAGLSLITSKWLRPGDYALKIKAAGTTAYHEETVTLVVVKNPLIAPGIVTAPGPGPNDDAIIKKFNGRFAETDSFYAMRKGYGANAVAGDIDGDGIDEIIVGGGADPNGSSSLDVFRRDGTLLPGVGITPFASTYGVTIAVGDIDGDWKEEVVVGTGPDPNTIAMVRVYKYDGVALRDTGMNLYPYANDGYHYGVNLALGDVDGDGLPEIITAPGPDPNAPPKVKAFKIDTANGAVWRTTGESTVFTAAFGTVPAYGANVASADLNADGKAEIVVGAGPDPNLTAQNVLVYDSTGTFTGRSYAAGVMPNYGAYVSAGDLDLDGKAEVITGSGPDPKNVSIVRVFREDGLILGEFTAYANTIKYGVKPAVGRVGE